MLSRLALILACGLALAAPSLADDNPPPICPGFPCGVAGIVTGVPYRPQAKWSLLGGSGVRAKHTWTTDRIYYAQTPDQTRRWSPYLGPHDRQLLRHLNFSRYGVLAIFSTDTNSAFSVNGVFLVDQGLIAQIGFRRPHCGPSVGCAPPPVGACYTLVKIRKGSLPARVKLLYIDELAVAS